MLNKESKELLPATIIPVVHKKRNNKLEELKNEKNDLKIDYINNLSQENMRKYLTPYARTIITNLYKHKYDDLYNYGYIDKIPKRIPHEVLIERSKKRVIDNLLCSMILPFEEQQIIFEDRNEKAKRFKRYNNQIIKNPINKKGIFFKSDAFDDINKLRCVNNIKKKNQKKKVKKLCKSKEKLFESYNKLFQNYNNLNNNPEIENIISNEVVNESIEKKNNDKDQFPIVDNQISNSFESTLKRKEDWNKLYNYFQKK